MTSMEGFRLLLAWAGLLDLFPLNLVIRRYRRSAAMSMHVLKSPDVTLDLKAGPVVATVT